MSLQDKSIATGILARIGLAAVVTGGAVFAVVLTVLVPPWAEATSKRQVGIFFSHHVEVLEQHFEGYDFIFSASKSQRTEPDTPRYSGAVFNVTEHKIFWPLLYGEWAVIVIGAISLYAVCSWRLRVGRVVPESGDPVAIPVVKPDGEP